MRQEDYQVGYMKACGNPYCIKETKEFHIELVEEFLVLEDSVFAVQPKRQSNGMQPHNPQLLFLGIGTPLHRGPKLPKCWENPTQC